jgi:capsular exopolysaccharide synthesis family protein
VASNLAAAISQGIEESVLLVDTDLRNSTLHQFFGMPFPREGLSTYLAGGALLPSLLRKTSIRKLTLLPAGNSTDSPAELLSSEKMKMLLQEVRDRYADRFVVIDSPPVELTPESAVIANEVDAVVFVVRYGMTPRKAVKSALEKIRKDKLLGLVFNGYNKPLKFYDQYGYHKYGYKKKK